MNSVIAGVVIPGTTFADLIPLCHCALKSNICQARAISERILPDARDAVRDDDARQARATGERRIPDARDAVRDVNARQARAFAERIIPDARDAVRDGDACQTRATIERVPPDARDAVRDGDARQVRATVERRIPDARDAVRNNKIFYQIPIQVQIVCIIQRVGLIRRKTNLTPRRKVSDIYTGYARAIGECTFV